MTGADDELPDEVISIMALGREFYSLDRVAAFLGKPLDETRAILKAEQARGRVRWTVLGYYIPGWAPGSN